MVCVDGWGLLGKQINHEVEQFIELNVVAFSLLAIEHVSGHFLENLLWAAFVD